MLPHLLLGATFSLILLVGMLMHRPSVLGGAAAGGARPGVAADPALALSRPERLVLVLHPLGLICFLLIFSWALANDVFRSQRIKIDQVLGGVVLYLNIGLTFAVAYTLVEHLVARRVPAAAAGARLRCTRPTSPISASSP